ncbi:MAG: DUF996 domain-containing protein [Thermococcus sp.]|nr:DUF996 domain-containing protein [Thermococcus sp.]
MWGSILIVIGGFIPYLGPIITLIGFVMLVLALKGIGDAVGEKRLFKYYLYSILTWIVLLVEIGIGIAILDKTNSKLVLFIMLFGAYVLIFLAIYFEKNVWENMYWITKTEEFKSVADWLWLGALLLIVLVGAILWLLARIYQIIAFSKMPISVEPRKEIDVNEYFGVVN